MARRFLALGLIVGILLAPSEGLGATPCCDGDCNGNAAVKIDDLILLVDIALGGETVGTCQYGVCPCSGPDPGDS